MTAHYNNFCYSIIPYYKHQCILLLMNITQPVFIWKGKNVKTIRINKNSIRKKSENRNIAGSPEPVPDFGHVDRLFRAQNPLELAVGVVPN